MYSSDRSTVRADSTAVLDGERTGQLPSVTRSAAPADELALTDLASVLAHRIRNIVAGIEGYTHLLADTLATREQRELALRIHEGLSRIEGVLNDLQHFVRPVEIVRLPVFVRDVIDTLLATLPDEDCQRIVLDTGDLHQAIEADPNLLTQALLLVLQNALEATPPDGEVRLETRFDAPSRHIHFDVQNDGTISLPDPADQVFMPFFTTKTHNLGIGLSLARRIAEAHGGHLVLAANNGREGTRFSLRLPAKETP